MHRPTISLAAAGATVIALVGCTVSAPSPAPSPTATMAPTPVPAPTGSPSTGATAAPTEEPHTGLAEHGVAAAHPAAVDAGLGVLESGGNAVDAAVATAFAVAVVEPFASGIGGGGAALVAGPDLEPLAYDYREVVAQDGRIPPSGAGIPGFVAGITALHDAHGSAPWADLLRPALSLAEEGFPVSDFLALRLGSDYGPRAVAANSALRGAAGGPLGAGDLLVQDELAATLLELSEDGPETFYTGSLAERLAAAVDGIDTGSLAAYEVVVGDPARGQVGDHDVLSAAPPLPGAALVQLLQVAEAAGAGRAEPGSPEFVERVSDAWQVADASVSEHLGDPAFASVPVGELTDPVANARIGERLDSAASRSAGRVPAPADAATDSVTPGNTTHLTVVDSDGLMVSMTNTITSFWGGGEPQAPLGFFLNDQLSRFDALDTAQNQPEPGRRSVSWAAPTMVLDASGRPVLGVGSPGGRQIPNILASVILRWSLHGAPLAEAVAAPRFHLEGTTFLTEEEPGPDLAERLAERGWTPQVVTRAQAVFGSVQALEIDHDAGTVRGSADPRREADVAVGSP